MKTSEKRVLLIEDDADIREILFELLSAEGFTVQPATNGQEGIDILLSSDATPQLILVDLMMPIMDGQEFLRKKSTEKSLKNIPTIVMSADSTFHKNPEILSLSTATIKKPIDINQFIQQINSIISNN